MLYLSYYYLCLLLTKLEKRAEKVLPGSEGGGEREEQGAVGERWPKQYIHI
jgi:hypothetical protein